MVDEWLTALAVSPARPFLLLAALALDALVGDPPGLYRVVPHPVVVAGRAIGALERRLNQPHLSEVTLLMRGALVVVAAVGLGAVVGWGVVLVARALPYGWLLELVFVAALLAQRGLYRHVRAVARALDEDGLAAGRREVGHIVGRDPDSLDEHGVARAAIESCAENFADGVVAPAFWFLLLGVPGLAAYKVVNTLDSMIGHPAPRYRAFGKAAARLDDAANFVPARIGSAFLALAALVMPAASPGRAVRTLIRDASKHHSPNAGWPEAAMAGALGLALAGPRRYGGDVVEDPWIGDGRTRATTVDIGRALYLFAVACVLNAGLVAALAMLA
ncbi:MAG: adenosylcobinamide-phosphate synthase CbiB [Alphaproteobacteria bacterium]